MAVGLSIFLDTITGVFRSVKLSGWKSIRSRKLSDLAGKVVLYNAAVITIYVIDHFLIGEFTKLYFSTEFFFTKIIALVLIVIELTSVKENFEEAFNVNIWKLLKNTINRAKEIKQDFE